MEKLKMHTPDLTAENVDRVAALFPNCVVESKDEKTGKLRRAIDFDQLRQELSGHIVEGPRERYHLDWPGKREALLAANAPIAKALRPCREESVDFDNTRNLFIEGDNLDVLKLLQETYLGKVKVIYIDPPYNTGKDFIYSDDFSESVGNYLTRSNQRDELGNRMIQNTESNGRFHSDWLTMLYSRLKVAQKLLSDDGAIFISIGDDEVANLRKICDEIFGEQNHVGTFVWRRRASSALAERLISTDHEYVVVYQRMNFVSLGAPKEFDSYSNADNDPRGPWVAGDLTVGMGKDLRPNQYYPLVDPESGRTYAPNPNRVWAYAPESMSKLIAEKRVIFPPDPGRRPMLKRFRSELRSNVNPFSTWATEVGLNTESTKELQELFGQSPFDYSKPVSLLSYLLRSAAAKDDLVLDFFAGSGTLAQALMTLNAADGGNRRFILVQLPEQTQRGEYATVADICKERIRRAGRKVKAESATTNPTLDVGFRVLKVNASCMTDVFYTPEEIKQEDLVAHTDNIREDRTPEDLLFQVLVDWGIDLALRIEKQEIEGKTVFFVDGDSLAACFDAGISEELVKELAKRKPQRAVFRDGSYDSDQTKINVEQIFKLLSPDTELKSL